MNDIELKRAIAETAATIGNNRAFAELMIKMVAPEHISLDVFSSFMPVRQLKAGDNIMVKVRKGRYPVRQMVPGTNHLADTTYSQDKTAWMFDRLIAGALANVMELQSGDIDTAAKMRDDLRADLTDAIAGRVFTLLATVWNSTDTPNNYTDASSGGVTSTALDAMIETIIRRAGSVKAIMGTRDALLPVYGFATSVPVVTVAGQSGTAIPTPSFNEYYTKNVVSAYKGIPLVPMPQTFRNALPDVNEELVPTDKLIVVGANAGQIALMEGFQSQDYTDFRVQPANYVLHGWQQYGLIVDRIDAIGIIKGNT